MQTINKGILAIVVWSDCHRAMIVSRPLLVNCRLRKQLRQCCSIDLCILSVPPILCLPEFQPQIEMSEVSLLVRKQEKKMTDLLVKKTHFTWLEIEMLLQVFRSNIQLVTGKKKKKFSINNQVLFCLSRISAVWTLDIGRMKYNVVEILNLNSGQQAFFFTH